MDFTNVGSNAGRIYDADENSRLNDFANKFNDMTQNIDKTSANKKNAIRYTVISVGAVLILVLLNLAVKYNKK